MKNTCFITTLLLSVMVVFSACNEDGVSDCPNIWRFDQKELTTTVVIENDELVLEGHNANSPNGVELIQEGLEGDFEISIRLVEMEWDSLSMPQLRLEVFPENEPQTLLSGVAVNNNAFYCYVDHVAGVTEQRVIQQHQGKITVSRTGSVISASAEFGSVQWTVSDSLTDETMGVRLAFGAAFNAVGNIKTIVDDFQVRGNNSPNVVSDAFTCRSW